MSNFLGSELKQLFTYSPIHFFTFSLQSHELGVWNQNCPKNLRIHQNWAYATKTNRPTASHKLCWHAVTLICWYATNYPIELQRSFGTCSVVLEMKRKNGQLCFWSELIHLFTYSPIHFSIKVFEIKKKNSNWSFFTTYLPDFDLKLCHYIQVT